MKRKTLLALLLLLAALPLHAQFFLNGEDPAHVKWYTLESAHYQLIYPRGLDSLARVYATQLEQFRVPVGRSYGVIPGDGQWKKLPVLLHPFSPYPNGSVSWAPARMDLYTLPNADCSDPAPWSIQLVSHEPRHQAQLQMGERKYFKAFRYIIGQAWHPVAYQVFLGHALGEGDAVTAETGIWYGSRARTADFLNYYRVALDQGDYRNWFRWRYNSFKHYTPDHYKVGYLTVAGSRLLTGNAQIMHENAQNASKRPWLLSHSFRSTLKRNGFRFNDAFRAILDTVNHYWQADALARGPLIPQEQVTRTSSYPVFYTSPQIDNNGTLFALREGYVYAPELVAIRDGDVQHVTYVNGLDMSLAYEPNLNRIYFMERRLHPRWKLSGKGVIGYYDIYAGKVRDLADGHNYFNPQPSPDGMRIAVAEYLPNGENYVVQLSAQDGSVLARTRVPDGYQPTEFGWMGDSLFTSAISVGGYGIYQVEPAWKEILAPSVQKVTNLGGDEDCLEWVSDPTGTNELYRYYPADGRLVQLTSSRYGIVDPITDETDMYAVSVTLDGNHIFRTPLDSLQEREVRFADVASYPLADAITAQEKALGPGPDLSQPVPLSQPKRYYKLGNPLRLHSWLPLYVNYDAVKEGSMDLSYNTASIGLTGFFQNSLGTLYGMLGYSLHRSPDNRANWRNALHAKLVYAGQYPVFEASLDLGDRSARQYFLNRFSEAGEMLGQNTGYSLRKAPLVDASLRVYVPLSWKKYGVNYGFIPQVRYSVTNNRLFTDPVQWEAPVRFEGLPSHYRLAGVGSDASVLMQRISASARGYVTLPHMENQVYPRLGIGAEVGASFRPGLDKVFTPSVYAYLYGYLPGFWRTQGLRLTAMFQHQLTPADKLYFGELGANIVPRGFDSYALQAVAQASPMQWKVTADYAIPIYVGDWYIPGIAHIRNFVLTPHADYMGLSGTNLWSAGADFTAELTKLILPFNSSLGVSVNYLGGTFYANTGQERPWSVELIFGMDF